MTTAAMIMRLVDGDGDHRSLVGTDAPPPAPGTRRSILSAESMVTMAFLGSALVGRRYSSSPSAESMSKM